MTTKRKVLLTGASGSMGGEALEVLLERTDEIDLVLIVRPSTRNKGIFRKYRDNTSVHIVWGDLYDPRVARAAVEGVDVVLNPAALISPAADKNPEQAYRTNTGGTRNLIEAIKAQPDGADRIRLVSVGSVAMYGDRLPPRHAIKVGDPLKPCWGDHYALSKIAAEKAVIESGIKHWVSLRQTFIAIPNTFSLLDPIMFHQPLDTHMELITSQDAGYGLARVIDAPDELFGRVYNMSGGPACRVVYDDYLREMLALAGLGDYRGVLEPHWFALQNFHCGYFADSHLLDAFLGHFRQPLAEHYAQFRAAFPAPLRFAGRAAPTAVVKAYLRRLAEPLRWIDRDDEEHIRAFLGSRERWAKVPDWEGLTLTKHDPDEALELSTPDLGQLSSRALAELRGGECVTGAVEDRHEKIRWRCGLGHEWTASRALIEAGHWCPGCAPPPWDYESMVAHDPLLAKVHGSPSLRA